MEQCKVCSLASLSLIVRDNGHLAYRGVLLQQLPNEEVVTRVNTTNFEDIPGPGTIRDVSANPEQVVAVDALGQLYSFSEIDEQGMPTLLPDLPAPVTKVLVTSGRLFIQDINGNCYLEDDEQSWLPLSLPALTEAIVIRDWVVAREASDGEGMVLLIDASWNRYHHQLVGSVTPIAVGYVLDIFPCTKLAVNETFFLVRGTTKWAWFEILDDMVVRREMLADLPISSLPDYRLLVPMADGYLSDDGACVKYHRGASQLTIFTSTSSSEYQVICRGTIVMIVTATREVQLGTHLGLESQTSQASDGKVELIRVAYDHEFEPVLLQE